MSDGKTAAGGLFYQRARGERMVIIFPVFSPSRGRQFSLCFVARRRAPSRVVNRDIEKPRFYGGRCKD
jgi:hypothetical protein